MQQGLGGGEALTCRRRLWIYETPLFALGRACGADRDSRAEKNCSWARIKTTIFHLFCSTADKRPSVKSIPEPHLIPNFLCILPCLSLTFHFVVLFISSTAEILAVCGGKKSHAGAGAPSEPRSAATNLSMYLGWAGHREEGGTATFMSPRR